MTLINDRIVGRLLGLSGEAGEPMDDIDAADCVAAAHAITMLGAENQKLLNALRDAERRCSLMAQDWCDFCTSMGVSVDTHEAVAREMRIKYAPPSPPIRHMFG